MYIQKIWGIAPHSEYTHMRIPGIIVTSRGEIIICGEARRGLGDWSQMDILARKSLDGGKTFEKLAVIDESRGGYADIAVDKKRDKIYVLYENEYGKELFLAVLDM